MGSGAGVGAEVSWDAGVFVVTEVSGDSGASWNAEVEGLTGVSESVPFPHPYKIMAVHTVNNVSSKYFFRILISPLCSIWPNTAVLPMIPVPIFHRPFYHRTTHIKKQKTIISQKISRRLSQIIKWVTIKNKAGHYRKGSMGEWKDLCFPTITARVKQKNI